MGAPIVMDDNLSGKGDNLSSKAERALVTIVLSTLTPIMCLGLLVIR